MQRYFEMHNHFIEIKEWALLPQNINNPICQKLDKIVSIPLEYLKRPSPTIRHTQYDEIQEDIQSYLLEQANSRLDLAKFIMNTRFLNFFLSAENVAKINASINPATSAPPKSATPTTPIELLSVAEACISNPSLLAGSTFLVKNYPNVTLNLNIDFNDPYQVYANILLGERYNPEVLVKQNLNHLKIAAKNNPNIFGFINISSKFPEAKKYILASMEESKRPSTAPGPAQPAPAIDRALLLRDPNAAIAFLKVANDPSNHALYAEVAYHHRNEKNVINAINMDYLYNTAINNLAAAEFVLKSRLANYLLKAKRATALLDIYEAHGEHLKPLVLKNEIASLANLIALCSFDRSLAERIGRSPTLINFLKIQSEHFGKDPNAGKQQGTPRHEEKMFRPPTAEEKSRYERAKLERVREKELSDDNATIGLNYVALKTWYTQKGKTAYQILGLESDASVPQIKSAYKKLQLQYHSDRVKHLPEKDQQEAAEKLNEILSAHSVLADVKAKQYYDEFIQYQRPTPPGPAVMGPPR